MNPSVELAVFNLLVWVLRSINNVIHMPWSYEDVNDNKR